MTRTINLNIDSLWCWQLTLYGFEWWLWNEGFFNNSISVRMGFRYRYDIVANFYLEKKDGFWSYGRGTIKKFNVRFKNSCDYSTFQFISQKAKWGIKKGNYRDILKVIDEWGLPGIYNNSDKTVRFFWMNPYLRVSADFIYRPLIGTKNNTAFNREFRSEYFFQYAREHELSLDESKIGKSQEFSKQLDWVKYSGTMQVNHEYRLVQINKKPGK